ARDRRWPTAQPGTPRLRSPRRTYGSMFGIERRLLARPLAAAEAAPPVGFLEVAAVPVDLARVDGRRVVVCPRPRAIPASDAGVRVLTNADGRVFRRQDLTGVLQEREDVDEVVVDGDGAEVGQRLLSRRLTPRAR